MEELKKKILMVHNYYQIGGGEHTVFTNEVELLKENGHKVISYTRDNNEINESLFKKILLPFSTIWSFKTYRDVKKIIKNENIDLVHCHNTFPLISPSVYYAARKMKIPVIQTIHNFRFLCPNALLFRHGKICENCIKNNNFRDAIINSCYRNSKIQTLVVSLMLLIHKRIGTYNRINYIFLTEFNKMKFCKLINIYGDNVFIKPNFVEKRFDLIRPKTLNNSFIFMGRLDENKGIEFLIDVWKDIKDYELHIYGDGPFKDVVIKASKEYNNIKYYGFREQKIIFEDLISSKGLLMPSGCYEGFPMTIAESYCLGIPVLSSDVGNQASIVAIAKGGCTYRLYDKGSFKEKIQDMVVNNKKYSDNAIKYYDKNLSPQKNYKELMYIYENAKYIR